MRKIVQRVYWYAIGDLYPHIYHCFHSFKKVPPSLSVTHPSSNLYAQLGYIWFFQSCQWQRETQCYHLAYRETNLNVGIIGGNIQSAYGGTDCDRRRTCVTSSVTSPGVPVCDNRHAIGASLWPTVLKSAASSVPDLCRRRQLWRSGIGYRPLYFNSLNVEGAQKVQAGRVASDNGPLYWPAKIHSWASSDMYINVPALIHIVIQKILNKSRRTWRMTWKSRSTPAQNIRIIVPRFEVDWITTQGGYSRLCHRTPYTMKEAESLTLHSCTGVMWLWK